MEKTSVEPRLKRSIGSGLEGRGVVRTSRNREAPVGRHFKAGRKPPGGGGFWLGSYGK